MSKYQKILIIEDDTFFLEMLYDVIEDYLGVTPATAKNRTELSKVIKAEYDLIVTSDRISGVKIKNLFDKVEAHRGSVKILITDASIDIDVSFFDKILKKHVCPRENLKTFLKEIL